MATSTSSGKKDQPGLSGAAGQKPTLPQAAAEAVPSFTSLVGACNNFTDGWELPAEYAYLCLPDGKKAFKIFGILQPGIFKTVQWAEHGFVVMTVEEAKKAKVDIQPRITKGNVVMSEGLEPKDITKKFDEINRRYTGILKGLKGDDDQDRVPLVVGHPDIKFPDKLGVYLGVLQIGVHLTVYYVDGEGATHIYVQHRSGTASYPCMLDQTVAGGLLYDESVREGLAREAKEEGDISLDVSAAAYDGSVVFSMVRPQGAKKLAGTLEISTKACFSLKVEDMCQVKSQDPNVDRFEWMSAANVLLALKDNLFKPNCALVMIKFLIKQGLINKDDAVVKEVEKNLTRKIVFDLPKNLETYKTP